MSRQQPEWETEKHPDLVLRQVKSIPTHMTRREWLVRRLGLWAWYAVWGMVGAIGSILIFGGGA